MSCWTLVSGFIAVSNTRFDSSPKPTEPERLMPSCLITERCISTKRTFGVTWSVSGDAHQVEQAGVDP